MRQLIGNQLARKVLEATKMNAEFSNVYDDKKRASAYSKLEFPGTYFLAFRDLPAIFSEHVRGSSVLDFGCGSGRSTRFLLEQGFENVAGVDIAEQMIEQAQRSDPQGDYRLVPDGDLSELESGTFDLVLAAFTFDNIPTRGKKVALFHSLRRLLRDEGRIVSLVSSPEIYINEWASFTTKGFPMNHEASSGDKVQIVMLDVEDQRPVEDILCTEQEYREVFRLSGVKPIKIYRPLGSQDEPYSWVSETSIAPWTIYVLGAGE